MVGGIVMAGIGALLWSGAGARLARKIARRHQLFAQQFQLPFPNRQACLLVSAITSALCFGFCGNCETFLQEPRSQDQ